MVGSRKPTADAADEAETLRLINAAIAAKDLPALRQLAASHGLLTNELRQQGWCLLAGADPGVWDAAKYETVWSRAGHRDRQVVVVDVARSLWALMPDASDEEREAKRAQLSRLLNAVLLPSPLLNCRPLSPLYFTHVKPTPCLPGSVYYYQGLHDVASVLLLVLGSEAAAFPVLQQLVGNQLRDATRASLDAVMELLDLTFPLLEECDPQLASVMKGAELPPFFALSWTITWWAHDVPRLQDVARLFDLFLAAHPCMPLYLGVAAMCCMRSQLLGLEEMPLLHTALVNLELPPSSTADPPQAAPSGAQSSVGGNAEKTGTAKAKRGASWGLRRAKKARGPPPPDLTNLILEAIALFDAHPPAHLVWSRGLRLVSSVGTAAMLDTAGSGWKVPAVPPAPLSQPPTSTTAIGCASSAGTRTRGRGVLGKADGRGGEARGTAGVRSSLRAQGAAAVQFIRLLHIVFRAALVGWPWIRPPPHLRSPVQWLQLQPVVHAGRTRALPAPPPSPPPPLNPLVRRSDVPIKTGTQRAAGEGLRSLLRPPSPSAASHVPHLSASQTMVPDRPAITSSPGSRVEPTTAVTTVTTLMTAVPNHQLPSSCLASTGDAPATLSVAVPTAAATAVGPSLVASNSGLVESLANDPGSAAGLRASSRADTSIVASHPLQVLTPAAQWHSDVPTSSPQVRQPSQSHQRSVRAEARQGSGQPRLDQGTSSPTNEEHPQHRAPSSADGSRLPRAEDEILRQRAASPQQRLSPRVHQRVAHRRRESESKRSEGKPSHYTTGTVSSTCATLATATQQRHMLTSVLTSMTGIVGVCVAAILISFALTGSRK
ncbi:rab-GTPase-TBC domain-containing protein [Haematococcus lacustris]